MAGFAVIEQGTSDENKRIHEMQRKMDPNYKEPEQPISEQIMEETTQLTTPQEEKLTDNLANKIQEKLDAEIETHLNEPIEVITDPQPLVHEIPTPPVVKNWWGHTMFKNKRERFGFVMFMMPIILMSSVSMIHLVNFFSIGTPTFTAWMLAVAFELASLSTIVALVLLRKMNKAALWSILFLLYCLQIVGNVYAPFSFIDPEKAIKIFQFFGLNATEVAAQRWVAIIQGALLPTAVMILFKMTSDYFKEENNS